LFINDEHDDEINEHNDQSVTSTNPSSADIPSANSNNIAALIQ
ncbi:unnamed protein product, partial [Rotaria sp. Silwood2]